MTVHGVVVDCASLAATLPKEASHEIPRDALLNSIEDLLTSDFSLICLEGRTDIGKTQTLKQFVQRHSHSCMSVFIRRDSWYLQDPTFYYRDFIAQALWALDQTTDIGSLAADETTLRSLFFGLQKQAKSVNRLIYIVIDGVDGVESEAASFGACLSRSLLTAFSQFRFVISGNANWLLRSAIPTSNRKPLTITGFSLLEAKLFLDDLNLDQEQVDRIYKNCGRGIPGQLASARRSLESGMSPDALIQSLPEKFADLYLIEWLSCQPTEGIREKALAILAHENDSHTVSELAHILRTETIDLRTSLERCSFLTIPTDETTNLNFASDAFRTFAGIQLEKRKNEVWQTLADYYMEDEADSSFERLPIYLENAGRSSELLNILDPQTFIKLLSSTDSFLPLEERCAMGLRTALSVKRYAEALRFHVHRGMASSVFGFAFDKAEVIAHLSLNDYQTALSIAQASVLKHHRLQLMATIAGIQKAEGLTPEATLIQTIESLALQVNPKEMGDQLIEVASDLISIRPDIAISMISRLAPNATDSRNVDIALSQLSAVAASDGSASGAGMSATLEDIQSRIKSPTTRRISQNVSRLLASDKAEEVLRQVKDISSAGEKLFLLRQWCAQTQSPATAGLVIEHAVFLALRTTEYLPTARDFRDLCGPLPDITDTTLLGSLVTGMDLQREAVRNAGPIQDYVQWQLYIAEAEGRLSAVHSGERLTKIYYDVASLKDLEVRVVCLALIVGSSSRIDAGGAFKDTRAVREMSEAELATDVEQLLKGTASHYHLTQGIIEALALSRPDLATGVIEQLNYESRRDAAFRDMSEVIIDASDDQISLQTMVSLLGKWASRDMEDDYVAGALKRISSIADQSVLNNNQLSITILMKRGLNIVGPYQTCRAASHTLALLPRFITKNDELRTLAESKMESALLQIGNLTERLIAGYQAVKALSDHRRELATEYLGKIDLYRKNYDNLSSEPFVLSLRLLIRSYAGLLPQRLHQANDIDRIAALISRISSDEIQVAMWADLAARMFHLERDEEGRKVVQSRLRPLLDSMKESASFDWEHSVVSSAPALYLQSIVGAHTYISGVSPERRERAYVNILRFLVTGFAVGEPANTSSVPGYQLSFDKSVEIIQLLDNVSTDIVIYRFVKDLVDSAVWKHNRLAPTQQQKTELARMILKLGRSRLPNTRFIRHEGFAILCEGEVLRLSKERQSDWEPLIERTQRLPNVSDRAFVLTYLAESFHGGLTIRKGELFALARKEAASIPSIEDRVERLELLAGLLKDSDKAQAKAVLAQAADVLGMIADREHSTDELRRSLVDLAYQIDPEFAGTLSSQLDQDGGRGVARSRIAYQKLKESIREADSAQEEFIGSVNSEIPGITWDLLGSLNMGRIKPRNLQPSLQILEKAEGLPISEGFPILSWFIENLIRRRGESKEARALLRDMFEALLSASEVGGAMVARAAGRSISSTKGSGRSGTGTLITAGQRARAINTIVEWMETEGDRFLYICDPYFGMTELDVLELVLRAKPDLEVHIITSQKRQDQDIKKSSLPLDQAYLEYWTRNFSEQRPPETEIVIVGDASQDLPVHDRWMLSGKGGIRLGTSFNQIGIGKDSEISPLTAIECEERLAETLSLMRREKLGKEGKRLRYETFWL